MRKQKAFTLIELLVVVAIIALLISILLPSLSRARELSKRLVCAANIKGVGTSFKIYANDNEESWPVAAFDDSSTVVINYFDFNEPTNQYQTQELLANRAPIAGRLAQSLERIGTAAGTTTLSTTRSLWMLVRSGEVTPKQFICPSSGDQVDAEANIDLYYDFKDYDNISYGYQVPYGDFDTRASEASDPRLAVAADKGPYSGNSPPVPNGMVSGTGQFTMYSAIDPKLGGSPQEWRGWNSGNHGGTGTGEGQNVLFADGHATFNKTPAAGIDNDNVFTNMDQGGTLGQFQWLVGGVTPGQSTSQYPGHNGLGSGNDSTTDSVIYP